SDLPARVLILDVPAHSEAFFREIDREVKGPDDMAKLAGIGERHQVHFLEGGRPRTRASVGKRTGIGRDREHGTSGLASTMQWIRAGSERGPLAAHPRRTDGPTWRKPSWTPETAIGGDACKGSRRSHAIGSGCGDRI